MSDELWLVYRDVTGFPRKQFEILDKPGSDMLHIQPGKLPGMAGYPDMFIGRYRGNVKGIDVTLVTYTEEQLNRRQVRRLLQEAYQFASRRN